ncbi:MAG: tRNA pseudouridine(54/55) synthase Pus10 [Halovenus sp.]
MDVLDTAGRAVATGPLCDACLGRLVADRSFGLENHERGRALRVSLALSKDDPFDPPEDCWVCEGECRRYDWWAKQAATAVRGYEFDTYQIGSQVPPLFEENDRLLREDVGLDPEAGELLKSEFNREVGKRFGDRAGGEVDFGRPDVLVVCDLATDSVDVQVNSAFVYGRYRKLERGIPQTEWPCRDCNGTGLVHGEQCDTCGGDGYLYTESVEELTAPVVRDAMAGESATFHGAGREDVDARMLGEGRPFVIEVAEPRTRTVDTDTLAAEIDEFADGKVEVRDLRLATYEMVERVKEHDASKRYRLVVEFDEPVETAALTDALATLTGATVEQETPHRVSHRRAAKTRVREVYSADGELRPGLAPETPAGRALDEVTSGKDRGARTATQATVEIHGEGGLYVKELVSSDDGRTEPSLSGLLGVDATVTALDVLAVEGEDEPFAQGAFLRE